MTLAIAIAVAVVAVVATGLGALVGAAITQSAYDGARRGDGKLEGTCRTCGSCDVVDLETAARPSPARDVS